MSFLSQMCQRAFAHADTTIQLPLVTPLCSKHVLYFPHYVLMLRKGRRYRFLSPRVLRDMECQAQGENPGLQCVSL